MIPFCFCTEGPKGLVGLRWREGMAERFGVDQTKAMGIREIKDNMRRLWPCLQKVEPSLL